MTKLLRLNRSTSEWEECEVPEKWKITTFQDDMWKRVNCAGCGEKIRFKDSFTSKMLRDENNLGYAICGKCRDWEMEGR